MYLRVLGQASEDIKIDSVISSRTLTYFLYIKQKTNLTKAAIILNKALVRIRIRCFLACWNRYFFNGSGSYQQRICDMIFILCKKYLNQNQQSFCFDETFSLAILKPRWFVLNNDVTKFKKQNLNC